MIIVIIPRIYPFFIKAYAKEIFPEPTVAATIDIVELIMPPALIQCQQPF